MPIIDAHAHIYPGKIAAKAVDAVGHFYCYDAMSCGGTPEDLLSVKDRSPITHFIVHSVATTPHSVVTINDFIAATCAEHPEMIGFGTMHPDVEDKEAEVERALNSGLHGFKLHPDTQAVNMDDPRLMEFYEIIAGRVPLTMHTGDYRFDYSNPKRLVRILKAFPDLVVDAAHMGGWSIFDRGFDVLGSNIPHPERLFVDASSTLAWTGPRHLRELIDLWGADRVMYGSDYPMWDPAKELDQVLECGLSEDDLEKVLWHNAERFSGVEVE